MSEHSTMVTSWRAHMLGSVRVMGLLSLVCLGSLYWCVRGARAESERTFVRLGERLHAQLGTEFLGEPQALQINGQTLFVSAKSSWLSIHEILERFDASCDATANVGEQLALLPELLHSPELAAAAVAIERTPSKLPGSFIELLLSPTRLGVLRHESADEGHFVCFSQPTPRRGLAAVVTAVRDFMASGDLSQLGHMRYVTAKKLDSGKTHVLAVWSEGPLLLSALFPESGDAPGTDMPGVSRPATSRRLFHAAAPGRDYAFRLYETARAADAVLAQYDHELPQRGWQAVPMMLGAGRLQPNVFARTFTRAGHAIVIGVDAALPQHTSVTLIDLGTVARSTHTAVLP